jgi:hypothetical protein
MTECRIVHCHRVGTHDVWFDAGPEHAPGVRTFKLAVCAIHWNVICDAIEGTDQPPPRSPTWREVGEKLSLRLSPPGRLTRALAQELLDWFQSILVDGYDLDDPNHDAEQAP